jgi:hypothetical protein
MIYKSVLFIGQGTTIRGYTLMFLGKTCNGLNRFNSHYGHSYTLHVPDGGSFYVSSQEVKIVSATDLSVEVMWEVK